MLWFEKYGTFDTNLEKASIADDIFIDNDKVHPSSTEDGKKAPGEGRPSAISFFCVILFCFKCCMIPRLHKMLQEGVRKGSRKAKMMARAHLLQFLFGISISIVMLLAALHVITVTV